MRPKLNIFSNIDKTVLFLYLFLVLIGWMNIYSAEYTESHRFTLDFSSSYGKQLFWIVTAFLLSAAVLITDVRFFTGFAWIIYSFSLLLLIGVLLFGVEINATKAWFRFGGFAFQPSEIAKYGTALALAAYIGNRRNRKTGAAEKLKGFFYPAAACLTGPFAKGRRNHPGFLCVYSCALQGRMDKRAGAFLRGACDTALCTYPDIQ